MSQIIPIRTLKKGWEAQLNEISKQGQKYVMLPRSLSALYTNVKVITNIALRMIASLAATLFLCIGTIFKVPSRLLYSVINTLYRPCRVSILTELVAITVLSPLVVTRDLCTLTARAFHSSGKFIFNQLKPGQFKNQVQQMM